QAPQNPTLDPILYGEMPMFANFEMAQLTKYGMPGVWTHGFVDMWSPGYLGFMSSNHNGLVRMYETFGNGVAPTRKRRVTGAGVGGRGRRRGGWQSDDAGVVSAAATLQGSRVVDAQQHELHGDRRAEWARIHVGVSAGRAGELLPEEPQFNRRGQEGRAAWL